MYTGPSRSGMEEEGGKGGNVERGERRGKLKNWSRTFCVERKT